MLPRVALILFLLLSGGSRVALGSDPKDYFAIQVVDEQTGRGVPLVQLRTTNEIVYYTDSNGLIAFHEPGLMDQTVFFHVKSDGYEFAKDAFGIRGKALPVKAGGKATLRIKRLNIAERLYRITGGAIYRDTALLGEKAPTEKPLLNGLVFGSDSVENAVYHSRIYWFWGDTNKPGYPLGLFDVPGATSLLPDKGGLNPAKGIDLHYFVDEKGFARAMAPMPGKGPTWIDGLVVVRSENKEHMFSPFMKIKPPLSVYERGLVEFDDATERFRKVADFPLNAPILPSGHPIHVQEQGVDYVYFNKPYPLIRVPATPKAIKDLTQYEAYTCLQPDATLATAKVDRTPEGRLRYSWKKHTPVVGQAEQKKLAAAGLLKESEGLLQLRDHVTGKTVIAHNGSVYWNAFRKRWVAIICESAGTSFLGEIWYAEGEAPTGPWVYAAKVLTHDRYSYYNPKQDPMFDQDGGRLIYFEGTYTNSFSGNPYKTPRYDYNQIMYRLDLADPRLNLPLPVYRLTPSGQTGGFAWKAASAGEPDIGKLAFFALDHPMPGTVAVREHSDGRRSWLETGANTDGAETHDTKFVFYALPADTPNPSPSSASLFEWVSQDGKEKLYSINETNSRPGFQRQARPVCRVWRNPYHEMPRR
jgi:hypothetical protein